MSTFSVSRCVPSDGSFDPWSEALAHFALGEIAKSGNNLPLLTLHSATEKPCLIVSSNDRAVLTFACLHDVGPHVPIDFVTNAHVDTVLDGWSPSRCRAYVLAQLSIDPVFRLRCLERGGAKGGAAELYPYQRLNNLPVA